MTDAERLGRKFSPVMQALLKELNEHDVEYWVQNEITPEQRDFLWPHEIWAFENAKKIDELVSKEVLFLREQDDKEYRYLLETIDIEGAWYTLTNKLDPKQYLYYLEPLVLLAEVMKSISKMSFALQLELDIGEDS